MIDNTLKISGLQTKNYKNIYMKDSGIDFNNLTGMMNDPRTIGIEFVGRF